MLTIDLNCDLGEGMGYDELIMPFISSANIACSYHAGDENTMKQTVDLCLQHHIAIGAHPSFPDKENFGRTEMNCTTSQVYQWVFEQLIILKKIVRSKNTKLHHVKPHGALYNMAAKNISIAQAIARAVKDFDDSLIVFGLSNSHSISESKNLGLKTANEVFADRTYQDDGSLSSRSVDGAVIEDPSVAVHQVLQMIGDKKVTTVSGKQIPIVADTVCLHGDGKHAPVFAKQIFELLQKKMVTIQPL
jgi:UPF0271 protein